MKNIMTAEAAMDAFINCKKTNTEVPKEVMEAIRNYPKWQENSLIGLLNASAYFPDILFEDGMEEKINKLLDDYKKKIVPRVIF